jgi:hypothetical protein
MVSISMGWWLKVIATEGISVTILAAGGACLFNSYTHAFVVKTLVGRHPFALRVSTLKDKAQCKSLSP